MTNSEIKAIIYRNIAELKEAQQNYGSTSFDYQQLFENIVSDINLFDDEYNDQFENLRG